MLEQKNIDIDKFNAVQESLSKEDAKGGKTRPRITWLMAILFTAFYATSVSYTHLRAHET